MHLLKFFNLFEFSNQIILKQLKNLKIMSRIVLPKNPNDVLTLIDNIIKKEDSLAPNGTLSAAELKDLKTMFAAAQAARKQQEQFYKQAEEQTKIYENALGTYAKVDQPGNAKYIYTGLRDVLAGKNKTNLKMLADWGFDVVDEVAPKKPKKA